MESQVTTTTIHPSVTLGNWILTMIIMCIPLVNIIMLFVWAFSKGSNPSKANWAKANLIFIAVGIVLQGGGPHSAAVRKRSGRNILQLFPASLTGNIPFRPVFRKTVAPAAVLRKFPHTPASTSFPEAARITNHLQKTYSPIHSRHPSALLPPRHLKTALRHTPIPSPTQKRRNRETTKNKIPDSPVNPSRSLKNSGDWLNLIGS